MINTPLYCFLVRLHAGLHMVQDFGTLCRDIYSKIFWCFLSGCTQFVGFCTVESVANDTAGPQ